MTRLPGLILGGGIAPLKINFNGSRERSNSSQGEVILAAAAVFGSDHFGRGFRGGFPGLYGFGGILQCVGYGSSRYALTPYGCAWICT
jgi:hypothetical protein